MNFDINAKKWREEHGLVYPEEYRQIVMNNYRVMMICCFFAGMGINEFIHIVKW